MVKMRFEGGTELAAAFGQLSDRMSASFMRQALREGGEPIRAGMESGAPRRTGLLVSRMVISTAPSQDGPTVAVGPAKQAFYGGLVEFGTEHSGPQPFARPAFDQGVEKALTIIRDASWRQLASRGISRPTVVSEGPVSGGPGGGVL